MARVWEEEIGLGLVSNNGRGRTLGRNQLMEELLISSVDHWGELQPIPQLIVHRLGAQVQIPNLLNRCYDLDKALIPFVKWR